jgi:hypothetical protein
MHKFEVGQHAKITLTRTTKSGKIIYSNGSHIIVNELVTLQCSCKTNNSWHLVWAGAYDIGTDITAIKCSQCHKVVTNDNKIWIPEHHLTLVSPKEGTEKYRAQVDILKLLVSGAIDKEQYTRLVSFTEGDKELMNLAAELIKKVKDGKKV